jgi:putative selenate reductase molybdopterin-binding subunit
MNAPLELAFVLNGEPVVTQCQPYETLLRVLRREGCFSVKFSAETGEAGAGAVLLDGVLVNSEIMLAAQACGHEVTTLESLNRGSGLHGSNLHPVQAAFLAVGAFQSGYSAGAMILGTLALLERNPDPSETDVRDMLSGILDRETAYVKPVEAVLRAAAVMRGEPTEAFRPDVLEALTDGRNPAPYEPMPTSSASPAVPRLVPSPDVPEMSVVGKPEMKVDGVKVVKGNPAFVDDIELRGMLYARVLHSPHAHARILDIDDSRAAALPGVHAVKHYKNTPRIMYASGGQSWPNPYPWDQVSFDNKVRHVGDRVAAVAAETPELAEEACRLIEVTYEVLPAVLDERDAMSDDAPVIHDEADAVEIHDASRNVVHHITAQTVPDDVLAAGFAGAHKVYERTFRVHQVQQCPIEPHIAIAWVDEDERLVIRTSTQVPFHTRRMVAPLLGLAVRDIRVIKPRIGGGFGAKQEMLIEDIVGHLALATRRPVRLELTREEEFMSSRTRHPQTITFKTGVDADGRLVAQEVRMIGNTGAYGTHGFTVQNVTGLRALSSYNCPAKKFDCHVVYTNIPVPGAYRGYGAPQAEFALECHMEDVAEDLGMGLIDFKRKNWVKAGDKLDIVMFLGERGTVEAPDPDSFPPVTTSGIEECVAQGMRAIGWHRRDDPAWVAPADRPNIRRGIGFAFCMHGTAIPFLDMGGCSIKMNDDGSFNVMAGAADLGTGADTVLAQIAAEVLGVTIDDIIMYTGDTDMTPFDVGAYASSTTYISGTAVKRAADAVRWRIKERAARMLGVDQPCSIELRDRRAWAPNGDSVSLEDIALNSLHTEDQEQIMGTGSYVSAECPAPFAAQFAEIEVDVDTGQVTVKKLVMAVDCGVAINPITASGQIEGGMVQALGYAHTEEFAYDEQGRMVNARFGPYWIYRADDVPATEVFLVQTMEDSGPFGAKAVAEIPKDGVAPAMRSAILNATGVALTDIPFTPERVWRALRGMEPLETPIVG